MFGFFKPIPKILDLLLVNVRCQQQDLEDQCQNMLVFSPGYVQDLRLEYPAAAAPDRAQLPH